jgi:hypothetical protein
MRIPRGIPVFVALLACVLLLPGCKREESPEQGKKNPPASDSIKPAYNPYKANQNLYNRERENLGNLDSLVTPKEPAGELKDPAVK